jgi:glycosyltransferase involved in cell wall biosynthesis
VKVSIVIPCDNEEETIVEMVNKIKTLKLEHNVEIIVIDDYSSESKIALLIKSEILPSLRSSPYDIQDRIRTESLYRWGIGRLTIVLKNTFY